MILLDLHPRQCVLETMKFVETCAKAVLACRVSSYCQTLAVSIPFLFPSWYVSERPP